jgi:hypothetical protein
MARVFWFSIKRRKPLSAHHSLAMYSSPCCVRVGRPTGHYSVLVEFGRQHYRQLALNRYVWSAASPQGKNEDEQVGSARIYAALLEYVVTPGLVFRPTCDQPAPTPLKNAVRSQTGSSDAGCAALSRARSGIHSCRTSFDCGWLLLSLQFGMCWRHSPVNPSIDCLSCPHERKSLVCPGGTSTEDGPASQSSAAVAASLASDKREAQSHISSG